jgi:hypothetical protein
MQWQERAQSEIPQVASTHLQQSERTQRQDREQNGTPEIEIGTLLEIASMQLQQSKRTQRQERTQNEIAIDVNIQDAIEAKIQGGIETHLADEPASIQANVDAEYALDLAIKVEVNIQDEIEEDIMEAIEVNIQVQIDTYLEDELASIGANIPDAIVLHLAIEIDENIKNAIEVNISGGIETRLEDEFASIGANSSDNISGNITNEIDVHLQDEIDVHLKDEIAIIGNAIHANPAHELNDNFANGITIHGKIEHELDANLKADLEIQLNNKDETRKHRQYCHDERLLDMNASTDAVISAFESLHHKVKKKLELQLAKIAEHKNMATELWMYFDSGASRLVISTESPIQKHLKSIVPIYGSCSHHYLGN